MSRYSQGLSEAAALRKALGLACRRSPGPLPHYEPRAYQKVMAGSELTPEQHVEAFLDALIATHPSASPLEICSWLDPGFLARELGPHGTLGDCSITRGNDPGAALTARGPAEGKAST